MGDSLSAGTLFVERGAESVVVLIWLSHKAGTSTVSQSWIYCLACKEVVVGTSFLRGFD
jgi:hypothetical protein